MPYFQRRPVEDFHALVTPALHRALLPSRGPAAPKGEQPDRSDIESPGIVALADAILAAERPAAGSLTSIHPGRAHRSSSRILAEQERPRKSPPSQTQAPRSEASRAGGHDVIEPAPVVPATGPVVPGGTARIVVPLVNEDDRPARVEFFGTGLVGDDGALIPATCVSFRSRGMTLEPGCSADAEIEVAVPANVPAGVYAGVIRASGLDDVHAVIVIRVDEA